MAARKLLRFTPRLCPSIPRSASPSPGSSSPPPPANRCRSRRAGGPRPGATRRAGEARGPHLAQLLVDELLQLRGFLRRQRHAGAGASPPTRSAAGAPTTRRAPARLGASVRAEHGAGATARLAQLPGERHSRVRRGAGQEARPPLRWRPTVVLKRPRTARRQGCPPRCRITSTCRFPALTVPASRPQRAPTPCPDPLSAISPSLAGPFGPLDRQVAGQAPQVPAPRDSKDPDRQAPPRVRHAEL